MGALAARRLAASSCSCQPLGSKPACLFTPAATPRRAAGSDTEGQLIVDGVSYPVTVQTLPTVVESYKTYDDVNLVKTADVGQVGAAAARLRRWRLRGARQAAAGAAAGGAGGAAAAAGSPRAPDPHAPARAPSPPSPQVLLVGHPGAEHVAEPEALDGVTPAMRSAAELFQPELPVERSLVERVEQDILDILAGKAPYGVQYSDVEEVYHVDKAGRGEWRPAK